MTDINMDEVEKLEAFGWKYLRIPYDIAEFGDYLHYAGRIYAERIVDDGNVYELPDDLKKEIYVEDIYVHVKNNKVNGVSATGNNPHISGRDYVNISGRLCLGDLDFADIGKLSNVPEMFKDLGSGNVYTVKLFHNDEAVVIACEALLGDLPAGTRRLVEATMEKFKKRKDYIRSHKAAEVFEAQNGMDERRRAINIFDFNVDEDNQHDNQRRGDLSPVDIE